MCAPVHVSLIELFVPQIVPDFNFIIARKTIFYHHHSGQCHSDKYVYKVDR